MPDLQWGDFRTDLKRSFFSRDEALIAAETARQAPRAPDGAAGVRDYKEQWFPELLVGSCIPGETFYGVAARVLCDPDTLDPVRLEIEGYTEECDSSHDECRQYDLRGNMLRGIFVPR